ncbi:MAG: phosphonate metabolism protein/1,5-bisphosphokinase (PRPP-forming) PhnN [Hyphomicrobium aestuarii]|nr:phosphonate metabolism protein/1,5-bisphosphokinase (PRPP-forming) PhnN [Hyphomicrobium aestuarii]
MSPDHDSPADAPRSGQCSPLGPGRVVLIVGPSGSGKDTLLRLARASLAAQETVVFAPRDVTRPTGTAEEFAVTPANFDATEATGGYALTWRAHGLAYGIRAAIDRDVLAGSTVVLNASRTVLARARQRYANVAVVLIDAPADVRAARLAARGREQATGMADRIARVPGAFVTSDADVVIHNTGDPDDGAARLIRAILALPSTGGSG